MIYENVELSGSLDISGSFQVPYGVSGSEPTSPSSGSLFFNTTDEKLYVWEGSWEIVGTQVQPPAIADIEYLVVAGGGGGGGHYYGGGGGAGGLKSGSLPSIQSGSSFTVTIGSGGSGGTTATSPGGNGGASSVAGTGITTISTIGGGGGAGRDGGVATDGGSGGGASGGNYTTLSIGGSGTSGQGNDGGSTITTNSGTYGAGGGGASQAGEGGDTPWATNAPEAVGFPGGSGSASTITGTSTYYAGGGGGGATNSGGYPRNSGGPGGGGQGGNRAFPFNGYAAGADVLPTAGTANTGGGGGGPGDAEAGASGGSGVVILAYNSGSVKGLGGHEGDAGNGRRYHKFGSSATFYIGGTSDFAYVTDSLLMHYDFANAATWDGAASTIYDLQGNHNLTVNSSPTLDLTHGGGLSLDGVDDYASKSSISFTPYMAEIWLTTDIAIQPEVQYTDGNYAIPLGLGDYPGGFTFGAYTGGMTNESIGFWGANYTSTGATYIRDSFSAGTYHIVSNWNGSTYDIWVNGSKRTTYAVDTYGNTTLHARDSIFLGRDDGAQSYEFGGRIHNVKIYNAQKTDADVTQNWNALRKRFGL